MIEGELVFSEFVILQTYDQNTGPIWDKFYAKFDWPSKTMEPPQGTWILEKNMKKLFYWPTIPFDMSKEKISLWIKWTLIDLPQGENVKMLTTRDPQQNLLNKGLDWAIANHTNTILWIKRMRREEKAKLEESQKANQENKLNEDILPKEGRETLLESKQNSKGNNRNMFLPHKVISDLKIETEKAIKTATKEMEEQLKLTIQEGLKTLNLNRDEVLHRIQEVYRRPSRNYEDERVPYPINRRQDPGIPYGYMRDPNH